MSPRPANSSQQFLDFDLAESTKADRKNLLGLALDRVNADLRLASFLVQALNFWEHNGDPLRKSYAELASRPWGLCCDLWEARETVDRAKRLGMITVEAQADQKGFRLKNAYRLNWDGVRAVLGLPPATHPQQAGLHSTQQAPPAEYEGKPPALNGSKPPAEYEGKPPALNGSKPAPTTVGAGNGKGVSHAGARARCSQEAPSDTPTLLKREALARAGGEGGSTFLDDGYTPPSVAEVAEYCRSRGNRIDAEQFVAYYDLRDWLVDGRRMRCWRSAVIVWERREKAGQSGNGRNGKKFAVGPGQVHPADAARSSQPGAW